MPPPERPTLRRFASALCLVAMTAGLLELAVRASGYAERNVTDGVYQTISLPDGDQLFAYRPGLRAARGRGGVVFDTNDLGLRAVDGARNVFPKRPGAKRVIVLGDSYTFGEGVPDTRDTYPVLLEKALRALPGAPDVDVLNLAVSGYSVRHMAAVLEHRTAALAADICLTAVGLQDFDVAAREARVDGWGHLVRAGSSGGWLLDSPLVPLLRALRISYVARDLALALRRGAPLPPGDVPDSYRYVSKIHETAKARGCRDAVVLLPSVGSLADVRARLDEDGIAYFDLTDVRERLGKSYAASRYDPHPSAAAHRVFAERLAPALAPWLFSPLR